MRTLHRRILPIVVLLAGCSTAPISVSGPVAPGFDAFACASTHLNRLGYTIEDGDRDVGFVRGVRQTSFLGTNYYHTLTAAVFDGEGGEETLRVTAARRESDALAGSDRPLAPNDETQAHALEILSLCGR
ncbi:MAG: hypothetical protein WD533_08730 [Dehalococcoidia bacterium]